MPLSGGVRACRSDTYELPETSLGPDIIVTVTAGGLPATSESDTLIVSSAPATAGFGDEQRDTARQAAVFDGDLYLGVENRDLHVGEVWRSADGVDWVLAAPESFGQGSAIRHVDSLIVFDGQLYAGTDSGQLWRTSDGSLWTQATLSPGTLAPARIRTSPTSRSSTGCYTPTRQRRGSAAASSRAPTGRIGRTCSRIPTRRTSTPTASRSSAGGPTTATRAATAAHGLGPGAMFGSPDGSTWRERRRRLRRHHNADISGLAVFQGDLYAGTANYAAGAQVWHTSDGTTWTQVSAVGFTDPNHQFDPLNQFIHEFTIFDGELYVGTEDDIDGGEIWRTSDGKHWTLANVPRFGTGRQQRMRSFFEFGGYLYATAENDCVVHDFSGCQQRGYEMWRLAPISKAFAPAPLCAVAAIRRVGAGVYAGGTAQEDVSVEAAGGLASVTNITIDNGSVNVPQFTAGTSAPVTVTATKSDEGSTAHWSFDATDEYGQVTYCG